MMGAGASGEMVDYDPMYGGYSGYPRPSQNPRSRGPRTFEELDNYPSTSYNGYDDYHGANQMAYHDGRRPPVAPEQLSIAATPSHHAQRPQGSRPNAAPQSNNPLPTNSKSPRVGNAANQSSMKGKGKGSSHHAPDRSTVDDIIFETYHHRSGETYTCMYQNGERFVMSSWATGEWEVFPMNWYDEGFLVTDSILRGGDNPDLDQDTMMQLVYGQAGLDHLTQKSPQNLPVASSVNRDDRDGEIKHPLKGIIPTYMFEEKRNIHCFFDEGTGQWVKLPISWELHSEFVKNLVSQVEEQVPGWTDKHDILASLRASNYDVGDCVTTWWVIGDQTSMAAPRSSLDEKLLKSKEAKIKELEKQVRSETEKLDKLRHQLAASRGDRESALKLVSTLQEKVAELEVANKSAKLQVVSLNAQLTHYKDVKGKQQQEELDVERQERLEAEEKARKLNQQIREMNKANKMTEEEMEKLKAEAAEANKKAQEYAQRAEEAKKKAVEEARRQADAAKIAKSSVDKKLVKQLAENASLVHQSYHKLKLVVEQGFGDCAKLLKSAVEAAMRLPKESERQPPPSAVSSEELEELKALYRKECLQRKILYNQLQELRGNIRVYARCRKDTRVKCALTFPSDEDITVVDAKGNKKTFRFDRVYDPDSTQEDVFDETCPIVTSCVDGYNVCILAYGQTGSGKTFTMMGPPDNPGVNIRAIRELLRITEERANVEYELTVSMVEIYNEVIQDLLTKECKNVTVQQIGNNVNFQGLSTHKVKTQEDITDLMDMGMTNRTVAATKMNSESSRSHLLVMLTVEGRDVTSNAKSKGTLTLVDLAGSERVSKTEASGQRLVEAAAINKSLTSLGQVFAALGKSALHVPFRNCKLTQVLQPSLSGDAKAALFVACSPAESNLSETISTLNFGANAKQIELGQAKKNVVKGKK